jgi:hypothetical protein
MINMISHSGNVFTFRTDNGLTLRFTEFEISQMSIAVACVRKQEAEAHYLPLVE